MSVLLATLTLLGVVLLEGPSHHVQGIDVEGGILSVTSVDRTTGTGSSRYDLALTTAGQSRSPRRRAVSSRGHPDRRRFGLGAGGGVSARLLDMDRAARQGDARLARGFEVADHIGCVAVADGVIWGGNWTAVTCIAGASTARSSTNGPIRRERNIRTSRSSMANWWPRGLAGPTKARSTGWTRPRSPSPGASLPVRPIAVCRTRRGHDGSRRVVDLLPEDDPSRLFHYRLP